MALHESEERLRLATDAAGAGLWNLEIETMQFWGSPQLRELLGFAPGAELTYELFLDTIYAPDREAVRRSVQHASRDGALFAVDFRIGVPNGNFRWIAVRGRRGGRPNHGSMIGLCVDATERKVAEEALGDLSRRLISAHEQERARLARELHDDLTQRLAILSIELGRTDSDTDGAAAAETARSVGAGLARLSEDVHALSYRLHPTVLEDLGLVAGLQGECDRLARQESLVVDVRAHEVPDAIPRDVALCLFRVLQESLRNVVRHANASGVEVSLRELDGGLQLAVCDDGVGFLPAGRHAHGHLGLASMHERLHLVGGELDLDSAPGKGTTVVAWVPLQRAST